MVLAYSEDIYLGDFHLAVKKLFTDKTLNILAS